MLRGVCLASLLALSVCLCTVVHTQTPAPDPYASFPPPPLSGQSTVKIDYPIVCVRAPRIDDTHESIWGEVVNANTHVTAGSDLCVIAPDGTESVLAEGGADGLGDPYVSFDGKSIYFTRYYGGGAGGSDIFQVDAATKTITQLTNGGFAPNRAADDGVKFPVYNSCPCPLPGGDVAFVSNRSMYAPTKGLTQQCMQLYRMSGGGANCEKIGHMTLGCALHPQILRSGQLAFSTYESQGIRTIRSWSIWTIDPDGTSWGPLFSQLTNFHAFHFGTQLSDGRIVAEEYYNGNDDGFGSLYAIPEPGAGPGFGPGWVAGGIPVDGDKVFRFAPTGIARLTPFTIPFDQPAPLSAPTDASSPRVGKFSHPCGAPGGHLLASWSRGPVNHDNGLKLPAADSQIVLIPGGNPVTAPNQMIAVTALDPAFNRFWPRPLVSYQSVYGMSQPLRQPDLANDGSISTDLPASTPYGLIGTSSLYKRESFPNGIIKGVTAQWDGVVGNKTLAGLDPYMTNPNNPGSTPNWFYQGADAGLYSNDEVHAIRIVILEPRTSYPKTNLTPAFLNFANERMRILGEFPVRKFGKDGLQPVDPDGNPDTSFLAKIPANTAWTFQTLDVNSMVLNMAQTWHQVRPGEMRTNCGGCHAHSQKPTDFKLTAAGQAGFKPFDAVSGFIPLVTDKAGDTSGKQWDKDDSTGLKTVAAGVANVEFYRDVKPILDTSCVACHSKNNAAPPGNLAFDDYTAIANFRIDPSGLSPIATVPKVYAMLAGNPAGTFGGYSNGGGIGSRYIHAMQSRRSLLLWRVHGKRMDGWTDASFPTETTKGDFSTLPATFTQPDGTVLTGASVKALRDVDLAAAGNQFTQCPPPGNSQNIAALSDEQKRTLARWVDLGCPIDLNYDPANPGTPGNGWMQDETPPTLTVTSPAKGTNVGPLASLVFGLADFNSGIDPASLSVTADFAVDGNAAGTELASLFSPSQGVYSYTLKTPLQVLARGNLTITASDLAGNRVKRVVTFTLTPGFDRQLQTVIDQLQPLTTQPPSAAMSPALQQAIAELQAALQQLPPTSMQASAKAKGIKLNWRQSPKGSGAK